MKGGRCEMSVDLTVLLVNITSFSLVKQLESPVNA